MPTYAVRYTYDDRTDVRDAVRPEHRAYLSDVAARGELLGSGPFTEGAPGALLVFRTADRAALDAIVAADPFHAAGILAAVDVRPWDVVIGPWAASV